MKRNEHINNWSGGIILLSFLLMMFAFSTDNNYQQKDNSAALVEIVAAGNTAAVNIEPTSISYHTCALNNDDIDIFNQNCFVSGLMYFKNQTKVQIKIVQHQYSNNKHLFASSQLVQQISTRKTYPLIS